MWKSLLLGIMLAATVVAPVRLHAQITDQRLGELVVDAVTSYSYFTIFDDVNIEVDNRNVRLTGRVTTQKKLDEIGKRVAKIDGIRRLTNDIEVLPASQLDADLRVRVARAIYNHPQFWHYAQMATPPIHIIVERGRIMLTGRVNSEVERMLAFSLAQVGGAFEVTNKLKLDRER